MSLELSPGLPGPGDQLNVSDAIEVERWSTLLGLSPEELKQAAEIAGPEYDSLVAFLADKSY